MRLNVPTCSVGCPGPVRYPRRALGAPWGGTGPGAGEFKGRRAQPRTVQNNKIHAGWAGGEKKAATAPRAKMATRRCRRVFFATLSGRACDYNPYWD